MSTPLHRSIREQDNERPVHRELEKVPWVIKDLVQGCCGLAWVVSHFELGNEAEIDFVVLHGFSGGWDVHFIELEPPSLPPFKKDGDFTHQLTHAVGQLRRWKNFMEHRDRRPYFAIQMEKAAKERDILKSCSEVSDSQGFPLTYSNATFLFHYHIVMGQRSLIDREHMRSKGALKTTDGFQLITYDRVLEVYERQLASSYYDHIYHADRDTP
jgi:hypothetical protein